MSFTLPQSTAYVVMFKAYLASDHTTAATGKTIVMTISKNGGAFATLNVGGTVNATAVSSGWYKVSLDTTDTNTVGPLAIRGTEGTIDDVDVLYDVKVAPATAAAQATLQADTDDLQTRIPAALVGGRMDSSVGAMTTGVLTAAVLAADSVLKIADALLTRDMSAVVEGSGRTPLQALRALRNKWAVAAGILTVTKENDSTTSWTATVTGTVGADPITMVDPT